MANKTSLVQTEYQTSNLEQVAHLLHTQANSASYLSGTESEL